jgi:N-acetylneuraminic acid mutarotase
MMNRFRPVFESFEPRQLLAVLPTIAISADPQVREGDSAISVRVRRGGAVHRNVVVTLAWSGSAKGKDLLGETTTVTIPGGKKVFYVHITAPDDGVVEKTETSIVNISANNKKYKIANGSGQTSFLVLDAVVNPNPDPDPNPNPDPDPDPHPTPIAGVDWGRVADAPVGRVEPETAVVGGKLYAFSGYSDDSWQPTRRVDRYDPVANTWTRLNDMPIGITHAAVSVVGSKVWFAGGYAERVGVYGQQDIAITTVKIYDTATDTWSDGPSLPQQRGSGGMGLINNKLYFTSGEKRDRTNVTETWMLDLDNQGAGWQSRAPIPQGRTHFGTVVIDDQLYIMGGQLSIDADSTYLSSAYRYNPANDSWTQLANLPLAMSHYSPSTVVHDGKIYLLGGEYQFNVESTQVLEYDPVANSYRTLSPLPVARAAAMAGVIDGKLIYSSGKHNGWNRETYIGTFFS